MLTIYEEFYVDDFIVLKWKGFIVIIMLYTTHTLVYNIHTYVHSIIMIIISRVVLRPSGELCVMAVTVELRGIIR